MVKTRKAVLIPIWVAFVAAALLLGLLLRTAPVEAPSWSLKQFVTASQPSPAITSHTITRSGTTSFGVPQDASQQTSDQPAGSVNCPTKPGIQMSCTQQR
jgi:hypothetical protein